MPLPRLTLITHTALLQGKLQGEAFFQCLEQALKGGLGQVLVREPDMDSARLLAFAARIRELTQLHQAKLIIHSQADIAQAVGADGVHVAARDVQQTPLIRQWLSQPSMTLSTSCHNAEQLQQAKKVDADWAFLSPVFHTQTHPDAQPLGVERFKQLAQNSPLPVIALGGIGISQRAQLTHYPVAVIRALLDAEQPEHAARQLAIPVTSS